MTLIGIGIVLLALVLIGVPIAMSLGIVAVVALLTGPGGAASLPNVGVYLTWLPPHVWLCICCRCMASAAFCAVLAAVSAANLMVSVSAFKALVTIATSDCWFATSAFAHMLDWSTASLMCARWLTSSCAAAVCVW